MMDAVIPEAFLFHFFLFFQSFWNENNLVVTHYDNLSGMRTYHLLELQ